MWLRCPPFCVSSLPCSTGPSTERRWRKRCSLRRKVRYFLIFYYLIIIQFHSDSTNVIFESCDLHTADYWMMYKSNALPWSKLNMAYYIGMVKIHACAMQCDNKFIWDAKSWYLLVSYSNCFIFKFPVKRRYQSK